MHFQTGKYFGEVGFFDVLADYRKYIFMKPIGLAFRLYHEGRYGNGSEGGIISPLYIGYPWLIRGYDSKTIYNQQVNGQPFAFDFNNLTGSRIAIANVELRFPFTGPQQLSLIKSRYLGSDINLFFDAGLAWDSSHPPVLQWNLEQGKRTPLFSSGISVRFNVMGYLVLEPYYAIPFQDGGFSNAHFGLNITPGW